MEFRPIEENLRQSFRILAGGRTRSDVLELPGVSIASLGVAFQMFNAAFLSTAVETQQELENRLRVAREHFDSRGMAWSFWICEDWLSRPLRRRLSRVCQNFGLRPAAEMPGMIARRIAPPARRLPEIEVRPVDSIGTLRDFRAIGSTCFHVPPAWFSEVFDDRFADGSPFACMVGYHDGVPVATAASVPSEGAIGLYNIATTPQYRELGYAEAITRRAIQEALKQNGPAQVVLQSTSQALTLYERMGFEAVTRIVAYNSVSAAKGNGTT
ncbi:MAG TPA: GNAT family N-acetyltransferase [Bryobacteraceae bacterium]|jgi:GNAT superfamily N-acetyltransferase|nr:GNAT family N-acetyltransferase [Bryobacteraceae bacterium]